ncbi:MAG: CO dehydrogenase/acetyl-CoA synthase subunit delta [Candidatus Bathyarchaeota archaeon]|nr:CO dehydrogenase/acetyl-CoA synthase subunit delta [Candidatus Bathyarchaeota archaeon]
MVEKEKKKSEDSINIDILDTLNKFEELELEDVELEVGELELWIQPGAGKVTVAPRVEPEEKPTRMLEVEFKPPIMTYPGKILEVKLGATKKEGGSRSKSLVIGGETTLPFYNFESKMIHKPVISLDVFDTKIPLAKPVKKEFEEVLEDPSAWAKFSVDKFGAEMVNLHLISIDPLIKDTKPKDAAKTVENVLQAVDVPIAVGGCGDPEKDLKVFDKIAEVAEGENILINSVTLDMNVEKMADIVNDHGHTIIAFTSMDLEDAKELNRKLFSFLPRNKVVIDTTTAALGYGLDYAFTVMERTRIAGLMGDAQIQNPLSSGTTNAWAAREAWMKMDPKWGPRELRGPIWETVTALTLLLAGVDYFMMMHPSAVKTVKNVIENLTSHSKILKPEIASNWVTKNLG